MSEKTLPSKLKKEPLVDVVCEVRFDSSAPASALLPGMLLPKMKGTPSIEPLAIAQLPQIIRDQDANLRHAPLMRMTLDDSFVVLFGDRSIAVGCKMPYAGWQAFKEVIVSVFSVLTEAAFVKKIERHSLKYVDFFESTGDVTWDLSDFEIGITIGSRTLSHETSQLRCEIVDGRFIHATTLLTPAFYMGSDGKQRSGAVVDVDTIRNQEYADLREFAKLIPDLADEIHSANKDFFFSLLKKESLKKLEPMYD